MGKPKSKSGCKGDIKFANSKKSKKFECATLEGQDVEAVGGLSVVLGGRLKKAGVCTAEDLSCKMTGMTKRNYLRYIIKVDNSRRLLLLLDNKCYE